jgi:NAD(P)-dependent dehydrogenase (short-subunit alcohol dehydrogenase family)
LVEVFAAHGWHVFAGARGPAPSGGVSSRRSAPAPPPLSAGPGRVTWVELDVCEAASVAGASRSVRANADSLDVLINNAAINPRPDCDAVLGELDFDAMRLAYDVNAIGPLRMAQEFLPLLERGARKLIVNVSSEAGSLNHSWRDRTYGYCMSKAALNMQTTILDRALRARGFDAIAIHPGWMRTDMGGPKAHLDPRESASHMYDVINNATRETPRFVQHDGKPFPW